MSKIALNFISHENEPFEVKAEVGLSLMEAGRDAGVPNIVADCGGACACATCHVHIDSEWVDKIDSVLSDTEESMLEFREDRSETSRLSCQIKLTPDLDGLVVRVPEDQY